MKYKKIEICISINIKMAVLVIIIGASFPRIMLAAPAITSANISGNTVTVSGTGFGTHADWGGSQTFLNKAWSNFDGGNLNGGNLGIGAYPENWSVQTSANRTNSSYYAEKRAVNGELGSLSADQSGSPTEWYVSFWFRMPPNTQAGKFLRIYGGSYNIYLSTGCDDTMIRAYCEGCSGATQWDSAVSFGNSTWKKFEFLMDESPLTAQTWINGVEGWSRPDLTHAGWGANGHTIDIGNMIDDASRGCGTAGAYQYDDVFINHTRARVEISTASTYSLTANREPQLPTAWSSSSISAQLNRSGYADGTYYLYVIDSTGAVNTSGYPITIGSGGGGDTTPPTSPTNLAATSPSQSSISVSWTASTDAVGVTGYIVERCQGSGCSNFAQVGAPTASPFVDSGLTANTFYNYHVRARDAANNLSGWSNVIGATTQSAPSTATRIFFDGSESGNTNLWSQDGSRDKCTSVTSAADGIVGPRSGSRMIRCNWNGQVAWNAANWFETMTLSLNYSNEILLRTWQRGDVNTDPRSSGSAAKMMRTDGSPDMHTDLVPTSWDGLKNDSTSGPTYWSDAPGDVSARNTAWNEIEYYFRKSPAATKVWFNGILIRNDSAGGNVSDLHLLSNWEDCQSGSCDATNYTYFDDFEMYSDSSSGTPASSGTMINGNIAISGGSGDTTPPTSPTNLAATSPSQSSISVSWTASTDAVGVTGYIVERCQGSGCSNFTQVGTPTASPFVDSGLTANTFYNYHVRARDAANNLSGWSNVVGATTQASTPASTVSLSANPTSITSGSSSTLTWSSTNATSCTASGSWTGTKATSGTQSVSPTSTSTYTLTCTGTGGSGNASATITVSTGGGGTVSLNECQTMQNGWIFCNDFDTNVTTDAQRRAQWDDYDGATDVNFPQDNGPSQNSSNHVAQFLIPQNTSSGDDLVKVFGNSYQKLYLRYYTKYASGFPFTMGNHGGGLTAGDRGHFATSGYRPGDPATPSGSDEWADFRVQYQSGSTPVPFAYSYNVGMYQDCPSSGSCYGDSYPCVYDSGQSYCTRPADRPAPTIPTITSNAWHCVEEMVDMGTPGQSNGQFQLTWNGALAGNLTGMHFRDTAGNLLKNLYLSLYSGDTVHTAADQRLDNIVVSTQPIGCGNSAVTSCNTVTTSNFSQSAYNSYGAPFDAFQTSTNLMNTQCNSADTHTINLTTGVTGDTTRIVYTKGYWYDAVTTAWRQYTGTCTGALNGEWCQGSISATITDPNVSTANAANPTYLVGMTCSVQGGGWKCGCRDTSCTNFSWQIQGAGQ